MAGELVETTRLWAHDVARIDPVWAEELGSHLVKRQYSEPRWSSRQGSAVATERVTLYGVPLVVGRTVGLAKVDPTLARELFIRHALVEGDWSTHHPVSYTHLDVYKRQSLIGDLATVGSVGNHSWDHPHFPTLTDTQVASQLDRTRSAIIAATGKDPIPFFRFPFGDSDGRTRTLVGAQGYQAVGWTVDSLGWKGTSGGMTASKVVDRVVSAARPGEIVLMHLGANPDDHTTLDADALPQIIERLRATGYRFVTLESLR